MSDREGSRTEGSVHKDTPVMAVERVKLGDRGDEGVVK